jgi:hypothetical protein
MTAPRFIVIDGKRHLWRDILKLRKEQVQAAANAKQPAFFRADRRQQDRVPSARRQADIESLRCSRFSN